MKSSTNPYAGYRYPPEIIAHSVWLYHRFCLSLRDVEELLAERGIEVTYETIRQWGLRFGQQLAKAPRHEQPQTSGAQPSRQAGVAYRRLRETRRRISAF